MNRAKMWKRISIISVLAICVIAAIVFIVTQCNDKSAIEGMEETEEETLPVRKVRDLLNLPPEIASLTVGPKPEGFPPSDEINGIPVIDATEYKIEEKYNWEILPKDEKETGIIEGFSVDDMQRCAILVNDKIMVYDETNCIFKCQFKAPESCLVLLWHGDLFLYSVSDELFFKVDLETYKLREYRLDDTYMKGYEVSEALDLNPGDSNTENGFYVTNHLGNRTFKIGYDMLIYVKDGKPQTVYSSYTKVVCWIVAAVVVSIVAALILLCFFYRKKKTQKQNEGQNWE